VIRKKLEILAPAGSMEALEAAVRCGADAVYLGQKNFSARKNSQNFDEEGLVSAVKYAHRCGVKIHQALNILVFDEELPALKACIRAACRAGVDALIVQDWGAAMLARQMAPSIPLHASTQMAIHSPSGVKLAKELGFSRVVLARELTREEIKAIVDSTPLETEVFVHGAHCMSVSGQCYLSAVIGGQSGNRGQCAQPCRLPFTACAGGKAAGAQALSLKDMSLVERLPELAAMGVSSVKIEGRMKRPEYVAAAVTACRTALDGGKPDMAGLQAVFSRSGFTSGYFDGERDKAMFGVRTKSDVAAAEGVLQSLRGLYHKEAPRVPVAMSLTLKAGEQAVLTLSDGEREVSAEGPCPEPARTAGTSLASAEKNLGKLGGTPYFLAKLSGEAEEGLNLPPSALNAMRREAEGKLSQLREGGEAVFCDLPLPVYPQREKSGVLQSWGQFRTLPQLTPKAAGMLDRVILPAEGLDLAELPFPKEKLLPALPRFTFSEAGLLELLLQLKAQGIGEIYCDSPAHLPLCREAGLKPVGGMFLNLSNSCALAEAERLGLCAAVVSPEGKLSWLRAIRNQLPLGIFAYGRLTVMAVRNCPVKANIGCAACKGQGALTDRMKAEFPVRCDGWVSYLYNSVPTSMTDQQEALHGFDFGLLSFTTETAAEAEEVIRCWKRGEKLPYGVTRGLYYRGV
jgi:putative protease